MPKPVILFLAANPADTDRQALDEECAAIERELKQTPGRDDFDFRSKWAVTVDELMRHLNDLAPTVIHFSGHGGADGLVLHGEDGLSQPVTARALTLMVKAAAERARVVVLNACYSDVQADALRGAIDCVIGMNGQIADAAARSFAVGFYRALGHRRSVGNAYEQAVATLAGKGLIDEAAPRCLTRAGLDANAIVLSSSAPPAAPAAASLAATTPAVIAAPIGATPAGIAPLAPAPASGGGGASSGGGGAGAKVAARYDLFLAHPSGDKPSAQALYDLLHPDVRVFLDARSIGPGERWDRVIPAAQRASRATVILISALADVAWYLGDEIVTAIALHRAAPDAHQLLPVLLEPSATVPYGLGPVQAIDAIAAGGLRGVAAQLRAVVAELRGQPGALPVVPSRPAPGARCDARRLHDRLLKLPDVLFEQLLFHAGLDRSLVPGTNAPLAARALAVAQLAGFDDDLCRRLTALLDERAPWTR